MPGAQLIQYGPDTDYPNPYSAADHACKEREPVFFAGRSGDLEEFLQGNKDCQEPLPSVLAGDDTIKFMINEALESFPDLTLDYISFANTAKGELQGRAVLANDAVTLIRLAAQNILDTPTDVQMSPTVIWRGLAEINGAESHGGLSGLIDFGDARGQVPVNKAITVQRVQLKSDPATNEHHLETEEQLLCGQLGDEHGDENCPKDGPIPTPR